MSNLALITKEIYAIEPAFKKVQIDASINFQREAGFAIQVLESNEYALRLALGNRQSVINAVTNIAAIGISLNPVKKQAYLVPRDGKICLDISYMGLIDLAVQDGAIKWAKAELVFEKDSFTVNGIGSAPTHGYNPFAKDRGALVGVYCVWKTAEGDLLTEMMSADEVNDIRDRSSAWKAWISKQKKCPWVTDYGEMARKTVVKRASKYWAGSNRLDQAIHHLNVDGEEGLAPTEAASRHMPAEPDGYEAFEAEWLVVLQDGAMGGMRALQVAFQSIPQSANKGTLWAKHKESLKAAAERAENNVVDAEVAQ